MTVDGWSWLDLVPGHVSHLHAAQARFDPEPIYKVGKPSVHESSASLSVHGHHHNHVRRIYWCRCDALHLLPSRIDLRPWSESFPPCLSHFIALVTESTCTTASQLLQSTSSRMSLVLCGWMFFLGYLPFWNMKKIGSSYPSISSREPKSFLELKHWNQLKPAAWASGSSESRVGYLSVELGSKAARVVGVCQIHREGHFGEMMNTRSLTSKSLSSGNGWAWKTSRRLADGAETKDSRNYTWKQTDFSMRRVLLFFFLKVVPCALWAVLCPPGCIRAQLHWRAWSRASWTRPPSVMSSLATTFWWRRRWRNLIPFGVISILLYIPSFLQYLKSSAVLSRYPNPSFNYNHIDQMNPGRRCSRSASSSRRRWVNSMLCISSPCSLDRCASASWDAAVFLLFCLFDSRGSGSTPASSHKERRCFKWTWSSSWATRGTRFSLKGPPIDSCERLWRIPALPPPRRQPLTPKRPTVLSMWTSVDRYCSTDTAGLLMFERRRSQTCQGKVSGQWRTWISVNQPRQCNHIVHRWLLVFQSQLSLKIQEISP